MASPSKASASSATTRSPNGSSESSERSQLVKTCQRLLKGDLSDEEIEYWRDYLKQFSLPELRYAFDRWQDNCDWFPKPHHIRELCEAYRLSESEKQLPIGCARCDWTGYYQVRKSGVERVLAECPCRTNSALRSRNERNLASDAEIKALWHQLKQAGLPQPDAVKTERKPGQFVRIIGPRPEVEPQKVEPTKKPSQPSKQATGIPTSKELAEHLHQRGHMKFVGKDA